MPDKALTDRLTRGYSYAPPEPKKSNWNKYKWLLLIPVFLVQFYVLSNIAKTSPEVYDPLGNYPTQEVLNTIPGVSGPALRVGETLNITAIKCNNAKKDVEITGAKFWNLIEPRGTNIPDGKGVGVRKAGCETFHYENPIPQSVLDRTKSILSQGKPYAVWKLSGYETPTQKPNGVQRVWESVEFRIYPATEAG